MLNIDGLPPRVSKGQLMGLLVQDGNLRHHHIGRIVTKGHGATIEITGGDMNRLVTLLDGNLVGNRQIRVWTDAEIGQHDHFDKLLHWLALEATAETNVHQRNLNTGNRLALEKSIRNLAIRSEDVGLGGKLLVTLGARNEARPLPWSRLTSGIPVILSEETPEKKGSLPAIWRGLISRINKESVEIALNRLPESDSPTFRIDAATDEVGRERMKRAISRVISAKNDRLADLRAVLLGETAPTFYRDLPPANLLNALTDGLNNTQKSAVKHALSAGDAAIIHGPPGTGKTTTVVALIMAALTQKEKVLACAPSNLAVDNMAERLLAQGATIVRIGHPIRILESLQEVTLDHLVEKQSDYQLAKKLRREANGLKTDAGRWKRAKPQKGEKSSMRQEAREMLDEARQLEAMAVEQVLNGAQVILSTLTGIDSAILGQRQFDLCVIDEAGQATEPATWIPLVRSNRVVLAGDHQQLPPTIMSNDARRAGFGISLQERLVNQQKEPASLLDKPIAKRLNIQYRMNRDIMGFSSAEFYDNSLLADTSVASHLLSDLDGVEKNNLTRTPVTFIDTAGASYDEEWDRETRSRKNPQEAELAIKKVLALIEAGVPASKIAIITPYSAQVSLLGDRLAELNLNEVDLGSVDGFQGRESEAVIISMVRSNGDGEIGFLSEQRRMNVALTRARRKLIIIGDSATITVDEFFGRMLEWVEKIGGYQSVWEEYE
ncbi:MAG: ATP-dependent RNA/DNA helicase IGHMBP2 [Cellvibrionaceae bacterium]